jgi:hypothetical protein
VREIAEPGGVVRMLVAKFGFRDRQILFGDGDRFGVLAYLVELEAALIDCLQFRRFATGPVGAKTRAAGLERPKMPSRPASPWPPHPLHPTAVCEGGVTEARP